MKKLKSYEDAFNALDKALIALYKAQNKLDKAIEASIYYAQKEEKKRQDDNKAIWLIKNRITIQLKEVDRLDAENRKFMYNWLGWKLEG